MRRFGGYFPLLDSPHKVFYHFGEDDGDSGGGSNGGTDLSQFDFDPSISLDDSEVSNGGFNFSVDTSEESLTGSVESVTGFGDNDGSGFSLGEFAPQPSLQEALDLDFNKSLSLNPFEDGLNNQQFESLSFDSLSFGDDVARFVQNNPTLVDVVTGITTFFNPPLGYALDVAAAGAQFGGIDASIERAKELGVGLVAGKLVGAIADPLSKSLSQTAFEKAGIAGATLTLAGTKAAAGFATDELTEAALEAMRKSPSQVREPSNGMLGVSERESAPSLLQGDVEAKQPELIRANNLEIEYNTRNPYKGYLELIEELKELNDRNT